LGSEYQPEPVSQEQHLSRHSQATAEAPADSLRSSEASEPREQDASPEHSLAAIRTRLTCCLKSRANPQPDWELLLEQTEDFAEVQLR